MRIKPRNKETDSGSSKAAPITFRDTKGRYCKEPYRAKKMILDNTFQFAMDAQFNYTGEQPVICLYFGCGRTLSPRERVFGNHCISHQKRLLFTSLIDTHLSE